MSHNVRPPSAKLQHKPSAPPFPADHDDEYSEDVGNNGAVYDGHDGGHEQYYYGSDEFSGPWQPTHRPPGYYEDEAGYSRQDYVHYDGYLEDDALRNSGQRGYHADQHRGTPPRDPHAFDPPFARAYATTHAFDPPFARAYASRRYAQPSHHAYGSRDRWYGAVGQVGDFPSPVTGFRPQRMMRPVSAASSRPSLTWTDAEVVTTSSDGNPGIHPGRPRTANQHRPRYYHNYHTVDGYNGQYGHYAANQHRPRYYHNYHTVDGYNGQYGHYGHDFRKQFLDSAPPPWGSDYLRPADSISAAGLGDRGQSLDFYPGYYQPHPMGHVVGLPQPHSDPGYRPSSAKSSELPMSARHIRQSSLNGRKDGDEIFQKEESCQPSEFSPLLCKQSSSSQTKSAGQSQHRPASATAHDAHEFGDSSSSRPASAVRSRHRHPSATSHELHPFEANSEFSTFGPSRPTSALRRDANGPLQNGDSRQLLYDPAKAHLQWDAEPGQNDRRADLTLSSGESETKRESPRSDGDGIDRIPTAFEENWKGDRSMSASAPYSVDSTGLDSSTVQRMPAAPGTLADAEIERIQSEKLTWFTHTEFGQNAEQGRQEEQDGCEVLGNPKPIMIEDSADPHSVNDVNEEITRGSCAGKSQSLASSQKESGLQANAQSEEVEQLAGAHPWRKAVTIGGVHTQSFGQSPTGGGSFSRRGHHRSAANHKSTWRRLTGFSDSIRRKGGELAFSVHAEDAGDLDEFEFTDVRGCNANAPYDWRTDRTHVDKLRRTDARWVFIFSMVGLFASLLSNEMIYSNVHPGDLRVESLKALNSIATIMSAIFLLKCYHLNAIFRRIEKHLHSLNPHNVEFTLLEAVLNKSIWIEFVILLPHCPPFLSWSFGVENMMNFYVYRVESVGAVYNVLRTYTFWRVYRDSVLLSFPKRFTISNFTRVQFGSVYVLKKSLEGWNGVLMIAFLWSYCIFALGYVFRVAESTACLLDYVDHPDCSTRGRMFTPDNGVTWEEFVPDPYPMNGFWMMFVTTTTVGYGDMPANTHLGRAAAVLQGLIGVVMAALLTASLSNALQWSPEELSALKLLEREKARMAMKNLAAEKLALWWKQRQKRLGRLKWRAWWQEVYLRYKHILFYSKDTKSRLRAVAHQCSQEIDETSSDGKKMDIIHTKSKYLLHGIRSLKWTAKEQTQNNQNISFATRQGIKMGMIGNDPEDDVFMDSAFKNVTVQRILSAIRRSKIAGHAQESAGDHERKWLKASDETREWIDTKVEGITQMSWHRKVATLDARKSSTVRLAGLLGPLGTLFAMAQNEWLMTGGSTLDEVMNTFKAGNSLLTVLTICCILRAYYLGRLQCVLQLHVHDFVPASQIKFGYGWLLNPFLWFEIITISIHNPPFYSRSFAFTDMGSRNIYVMQSESLMASFNMLRMYLFWRIIRDWMVEDLPKRCTLAGFQRLKIGSAFAVKRMLHSNAAVLYIFLWWLVILFLLSYWFRAVEITACQFPGIGVSERNPWCEKPGATEWTVGRSTFLKQNDYYMYTALWFMCVTSTSVGYGDVTPTTSIGRGIAAAAAVIGMALISLLTASMAALLQWSAQEANANVISEREINRLKRQEVAAFIIQVWWLRRLKGTQHASHVNMRRLFLELSKLTMSSRIEIDDAAGFHTKIDQTFVKLKKTDEIMEQMGHIIWYDEMAKHKHHDARLLTRTKTYNAEQDRQRRIRQAQKSKAARLGLQSAGSRYTSKC